MEQLYSQTIHTFIFGKQESQEILLQFLNDTMDRLHILIYKYVEGLVSIACEMLVYHHSFTSIRILSKLHQKCHLRIQDYYPLILVSIAECYPMAKGVFKSALIELLELMKDDSMVLRDLQALVDYDSVYKDLVINV